MIHFQCPGCRCRLKVDNAFLDRKIICPRCGQKSPVQRSAGELAVAGRRALATKPAEESVTIRINLAREDDDLPALRDGEDLSAGPRPRLLYGAVAAACVLALASGMLACVLVWKHRQPLDEGRRPLLATKAAQESPATPRPGLVESKPTPTSPPVSIPASGAPGPTVAQPRFQPPDQPPNQGGTFENRALRGGKQSPTAPRFVMPALPADPVVDEATQRRVESLMPGLKSAKAAERIKAAYELAQLGPQAIKASRALCDSMLDGNADTALAASQALELVNPVLQPLVVTVLVDSSAANRRAAVERIGLLGERGSPAIAILVQYHLRSGEPYGKGVGHGTAAVQALAYVGVRDRQVTELFSQWLMQDTNPQVRQIIARSLPYLTDGRKAIKGLVAVLRTDGFEDVRAAAAFAVGELGDGEKPAEDALVLAKLDPSAQVRRAASAALIQLQQRQAGGVR